MMDWIYFAISWILLRWHELWDAILPDGTFLATNWDWILAIVFLVITVRIILFPVFVKQIRSQRAMQAIQPKMKELQEKHKGDRETLQKEMMELYRKEKVNPLMGCLPIFLQIPVFLGLFWVLSRIDPYQTMNTTIYGWTQEQWDGAKVARLFDAPIVSRFATSATDLAAMDANGIVVKVVAGILVLIMMATTYLTSRQMILKTGWSADPQQRMIQKLMLYGIPITLLLSGWYFPIGVIIYWVVQNLFSLGQQFWVLHKYPPPAMAGATPAGRAGRNGAGKTTGTSRATGTTKTSGTAKASGTTKTSGTAKASGTAKGTAKASDPTKTSESTKPAAKAGAAPGKADGGSAGDGKAPAKERSGILGRKRDAAPTAPAAPQIDGKALAPKPGAKPLNRKKGGAKR
jgi:YidC/Oxa1 family membrane protein insertase